MKHLLDISELLFYKIIQYIVKPFQITKLIEMSNAMNWTWFAILSILPEHVVSSRHILDILRPYFPGIWLTVLLLFIAGASVVSLWQNIVKLRQMIFLFNICVILFFISRIAFTLPIASATGYFVILLVMNIIAFWRMDINRY